MRERLGRAQQNVGRTYRRFSAARDHFIIEEFIPVVAVSMGAFGGADIAEGNTLRGYGQLGLAAVTLVADTVIRTYTRERPSKPAPLYQSLDGKTTIYEPMQLLRHFPDPYKAAVRVGKILRQPEPTSDEIEYLRMADRAISLLPGIEARLSSRQDPRLPAMRATIQAAEAKYK